MVEREQTDEQPKLGRTGHRHTRTGAADYLENEQDWLGSFFVDLNELTRNFNRKLRHKGGEGALSRAAAEDEDRNDGRRPTRHHGFKRSRVSFRAGFSGSFSRAMRKISRASALRPVVQSTSARWAAISPSKVVSKALRK